MICQVCKQRKATTRLKRTINGDTTEMYVCTRCASSQGAEFFGTSPFDIGNFFGGLLVDPTYREDETSLRCQTCSKTFQDIVREGRVGCADCYSTFYDQLLPSIQRIHGKTTHVGKQSGGIIVSTIDNTQDEIEVLKNQLKKSVEAQEYEKCAELRDRIKSLEEQSINCGKENYNGD